MSMVESSEVRIVRLMAGVAERAAGMLGGNDLREFRRFGRVLLVTASAEIGDVGKGRLQRRRIVRVLCLRTVARLARDLRMTPGRPRLPLILVAHQAAVL